MEEKRKQRDSSHPLEYSTKKTGIMSISRDMNKTVVEKLAANYNEKRAG